MTNNPVYLFFHTPRNLGPFVVRMTLAGYFLFHGTQRALGWFGGTGWNGTLDAWTSPTGPAWPMLLVVIFLVGELIVCLSLFLGFFSRLAGLTVAGIMTLKIVILAQHSPFQTSYELPMMIWAMGLAILCLGGGALSTDRAISENLLPVIG